MLRKNTVQTELQFSSCFFAFIPRKSSELEPTLVAGPQYSTGKNKVLSTVSCLR